MSNNDVEMKDVSAAKDGDKQDGKQDEQKEEIHDPFFDFKRVLVLLEKGAKDKDYKLCGTLTKKYKKLRKDLSINDVVLLLKYFLPELYKRIGLV